MLSVRGASSKFIRLTNSNLPLSLFQRGNFLGTFVFTPSLKKHALSNVEGRGRGDFLSE
jgi:hypothetical protein